MMCPTCGDSRKDIRDLRTANGLLTGSSCLSLMSFLFFVSIDAMRAGYNVYLKRPGSEGNYNDTQTLGPQ